MSEIIRRFFSSEPREGLDRKPDIMRREPGIYAVPTIMMLDLLMIHKPIGTAITQLVSGRYVAYDLILIANPANAGDVTIGMSGESAPTFPLLETAYLYFSGDLDKIHAVGTDASDAVDIILQKRRGI